MSDATDAALPLPAAYELVYSSIRDGCSFKFPCDEGGVVELNALSERALANYLMARVLVGREFYAPTVVRKVPGVDLVHE